MKITITMGLAAGAILLAGCGKSSQETGSVPTAKNPTDTAPPSQQTESSPAPAVHSVASPVTQPILAVWQEGDKAKAISLFVGTDWSARPTFASGMALSLSEDQFKALPEADRELKARETVAQLDLIKQVAAQVAQAGRNAASMGNTDLARQYFASLKQFGVALDSPDRLRLVRLVGQTCKNMANGELAKIGKQP